MRADRPVPPYGLAGDFGGTRTVEGHGRDLVTVVHRGDGPEAIVGVERNAVFGTTPGQVARGSMAVALVVDLPNTDRHNVEARLAEAGRSEGWTPRELILDGEPVRGEERTYDGMWIVYGLTPSLMIYLLGPPSLGETDVSLRQLDEDEVELPDGWSRTRGSR